MNSWRTTSAGAETGAAPAAALLADSDPHPSRRGQCAVTPVAEQLQVELAVAQTGVVRDGSGHARLPLFVRAERSDDDAAREMLRLLGMPFAE